MTADSSSHEKVAFFTRPMVALVRLTLRFPIATLVLAGVLTIFSLLYTAQGLGYRTSRLDLLNPNNDYNRLWIEYIDEFGDDDDAVVVVEGANRDQVVPVLREISTVLGREDRLFHAVLHGVNLEKIRSKGLHYISPEELLGLEGFLQEMGPVIGGDWSRLNLSAMTAGMCLRLEAQNIQPGDPRAEPTLNELQRLAEGLQVALTGKNQYHSPWPEMSGSFSTLSDLSSEYLLTNEGRMGFVLLRLSRSEQEGFARGTEATDTLRKLIAQLQAKHPETTIGLTGLPIMENDEMRASQSSMVWASVVSFVGVALLFVAGFGGIRHALLANIVLLVAMAWAFAYVTATVGHLNILSVSFTATLIGIGIDYGVHYVARYLQIKQKHPEPNKALVETTRSVGPAIVTGAVTTAIAFFAASFTSFTGVAELGMIAGGGILICCFAELYVLPAAVSLVDRTSWGQKPPEPLPIHAWIAPLLKNPRKLLLSTLLFTGVVALGVDRLWYDHNLLNLQAEGLESVELERKLLSECNQSVWYAVSMADSREELLARKEKLLKLGSVERTEEIVSLLPVDLQTKQPIIARIHDRLASLPERPPLLPVEQPEQLGQVFAQAQQLAVKHQRLATARHLEHVRDTLRRMPLSDCYAQLSLFQQQVAGDLLSRLHALRGMANPEPPQLSDLPTSLVNRFVGQHDRHLLKIYGRGNIWDMDALSAFVADVRSVDPRATGNPLQAYEASLEMKSSFETAALYSLAIILAVLWFDFRHIGYALLAAMPLGVGVLQMFGLMGLLNIPLNPANMIALPLILGIGVDYGVHMVHDYRANPGRYRLQPSTAIAVVVDSLTTIVGFGALMIASHRGLQSLGRVLTIGVTCCFFTSLIMLPALLTWMSWNRDEGETEAEPDDEESPHRTSDRPRDGARFDKAHHAPNEPSRKESPQESSRQRR